MDTDSIRFGGDRHLPFPVRQEEADLGTIRGPVAPVVAITHVTKSTYWVIRD